MNIKRIVAGLFLVLTMTAVSVQAKDEASQMAKMQELGTPGAEHAILDVFKGKWKVTSRSWMTPGAKAEESTGTSSMEWVLDGRFLKQKYKGEWAGEKFDGMGFVGFDKMKKKYVNIWMDSMATGVFQSMGRYDSKTKTFKDSGNFSCPMTGNTNEWFRSEWKIINDNQNIYTMYMKDKNDKEFKAMELTYTRK